MVAPTNRPEREPITDPISTHEVRLKSLAPPLRKQVSSPPSHSNPSKKYSTQRPRNVVDDKNTKNTNRFTPCQILNHVKLPFLDPGVSVRHPKSLFRSSLMVCRKIITYRPIRRESFR